MEDRYIFIIESLANGVNPITGEVFDNDSVYNNPEVIRALFFVLEKVKKSKTKKTIEEKQNMNISNGKPKNHGLPWTKELKEELKELFKQNKSISELANIFERTKGSIISELLKQELITEEEKYLLKVKK